MKKTEWNAGLDNIAPELVEKYVKQRDMHRESRKRRSVRTRLFAAAVCAVLAAGSVCAFVMLRPDDPAVPAPDTCELTPPELPDWSGAKYSAQDIAGMFDLSLDSSATNNYLTFYVPRHEYLYIGQLQDGGYIDIYTRNEAEHEVDIDKYEERVSTLMSKLSSSLGGAPIPQYKTESESGADGSISLRVSESMGDFRLSFFETELYTSCSVSNRSTKTSPIVLSGERVEIDAGMSDDDILRSLENVRSALFDLFDARYEDAAVVRSYSSSSVEYICVRYYNKSEDPMHREDNISLPFGVQLAQTDSICIYFYNRDNKSTDALTEAEIEYVDFHTEPLYSAVSSEKLIPLDTAEKLLLRGYVFGFHACSLCMQEQERITFDTYDYVDIEYMSGKDPESGKWISIPFYAFYKKIGEAENGNLIFAKTYVAAIELSGYEEYFESIAAKAHK